MIQYAHKHECAYKIHTCSSRPKEEMHKCTQAYMPHSGVQFNASISDEHQPASEKGHQG